jgi:hypothetical protein
MSHFTLVRPNHHPRSVSVRSAQKKELGAAAELFRLGRDTRQWKNPISRALQLLLLQQN